MERPDLSTIKPAKKKQLVGDEVDCFIDCISDSTLLPTLTKVNEEIFYVDDALNPCECRNLTSIVNKNSALTFWSEGDKEKIEFRMFRNADTIEVNSFEFVDRIWQRISSLLTNLNITVDADNESDVNHERELVGNWDVCGLNQDMLFARYPPHGSFAPHTDGRAIVNFNLRSFYSVIIFLNDIPKGMGGGTRFYKSDAVQQLKRVDVEGNGTWSADKDLITHEIDPVAGRVLIFHQSLVHEGVPPLEGYEKYIIRSDVMLKRRVPICDSEVDKAAYAMFRQAEDLAESGLVNESLVLFKKALKLSPVMAEYMGQA